MNNSKRNNTAKTPPQIKVLLTDEDLSRIDNGPLASTGGRGRSSWVKQLIFRELALYEETKSGKTQLDPRFFMRIVDDSGSTPLPESSTQNAQGGQA